MKKIYLVLIISFFQFAVPQISNAKMSSSCKIGKIFYDKGEYSKAFAQMKTLATYGDHCAEYYLGLMYFNGEGTKKNLELSAKYIELAAKGKYPEAMGFYDRQE